MTYFANGATLRSCKSSQSCRGTKFELVSVRCCLHSELASRRSLWQQPDMTSDGLPQLFDTDSLGQRGADRCRCCCALPELGRHEGALCLHKPAGTGSARNYLSGSRASKWWESAQQAVAHRPHRDSGSVPCSTHGMHTSTTLVIHCAPLPVAHVQQYRIFQVCTCTCLVQILRALLTMPSSW